MALMSLGKTFVVSTCHGSRHVQSSFIRQLVGLRGILTALWHQASPCLLTFGISLSPKKKWGFGASFNTVNWKITRLMQAVIVRPQAIDDVQGKPLNDYALNGRLT
jgi:hypothetical protein